MGPRGLFRGASACLLRDIPFSAIYFTTYGRLKSYVSDYPFQKLPVHKLFFCALTAGVIASSTATPADVIKTRLQVSNSQYKGIVDCAVRTFRGIF